MTTAFHRALPLLVALIGCSDVPITPPPDPPPPEPESATLQLVPLEAGNGQSGVAGTMLPRPIQVRVTRNGVPVGGHPVQWSTQSGTLSLSSSFTDGLGYATVRWWLGERGGTAIATAAIGDAPDQVAEFRATVWPVVTVQSAGDRLAGEVGTPLATPLRIRVTPTREPPQSGIPVDWSVAQGTVYPTRSYTDQNGIATATWSLGPTAGTQHAFAQVRGHVGGPFALDAEAAAGPPAVIELNGSYPPRPSNLAYFVHTLGLRVTDRYGNVVVPTGTAWELMSGPAILSAFEGHDLSNSPGAFLAPTGTPGVAVVRATVAPTGITRDFSFTFTEAAYEVHLRYYQFVSPMNGTNPAVDTIPVGATLRWLLTPFDYDDHAVESVGTPAFVGGEFPYANPSRVSATFTAAGTYRYRDPHSGATGTVVVQ